MICTAKCLVLSIMLLPATVLFAEESKTSAKLHGLLDQRFQVVAEGQLLEMTDSNCYTLRVFGSRESKGCSETAIYGSFKRVKRDADEYVCVSFRGWACFRSEAQ